MKRKIAPRGGLQSTRGAIMLCTPNNSRCQATGKCLPIHLAITLWWRLLALQPARIANRGAVLVNRAIRTIGSLKHPRLAGTGKGCLAGQMPVRRQHPRAFHVRPTAPHAECDWRMVTRPESALRDSSGRGPSVKRCCHIPP